MIKMVGFFMFWNQPKLISRKILRNRKILKFPQRASLLLIWTVPCEFWIFYCHFFWRFTTVTSDRDRWLRRLDSGTSCFRVEIGQVTRFWLVVRNGDWSVVYTNVNQLFSNGRFYGFILASSENTHERDWILLQTWMLFMILCNLWREMKSWFYICIAFYEWSVVLTFMFWRVL